MTPALAVERSACDLCHTRKVKCDRLDPCMNCVDARAECRRTRPRRSMRPRISRISGLSDRISSLEQFISNPQNAVPPSAPASVISSSHGQDRSRSTNPSEHGQNVSGHAQVSGTGSVKRKFEDAEATVDQSAEPPTTRVPPMHRAFEARQFIQGELQHSDHIPLDRRTVFEQALSLVDRISASSSEPRPASADEKNAENEEVLEPQKFSLEVYYMMATDMAHQHSPGKHFHWPDHISVQGLEHMSLSIAEGRLDRQTSLHYQVCVFTKALFYMTRVPKHHLSERLRMHLKRSQQRYALAASRALDEINFVGSNSISLVQALLSGALFHQMQGNPIKGWTLTAIASQILVSMNYHNIKPNTTAQSDEDQDARRCVFSCFFLDKALSMLLLRPPSLPRLKVSPASLVPLEHGVPLGLIVKTVVELAQIQDQAMEIYHHGQGPEDAGEQAAKLSSLAREMVSLHATITERRVSSKQGLQLEWTAVEFRFQAVLTTLIHLKSQALGGAQVRDECLFHARNALGALGRLQKTLNDDHAFVGVYPFFLSWTVLFYPMTPFYILFCNVVCTSNPHDFHLMSETTQGLYQFIESNPAIAKLHHLFTTFLTLCSPLVQSQSQNYSHEAEMSSETMSWWNSTQMWELFGTQPSFEWVDSDLLVGGVGDGG
ncbi:hypothetical protein BO70DRAFT_385681 [Aspergillus heteromorphus CBS 117.55]|uniref:Zn(2)-C6 fungal-type domain-containing protein n=1 Tax=Aspergillus heteromorphus CBS 117.55 TaxID=1448321 RepID=A0A317WQ34_9EURO|nr:uncharacterized protein BO70DRAFT_385681 [Aspergillus heteromorphus CBS 117.55]PWY88539.1 hypothetical protein BO70DRAFT_385681 [Aspergillus heteromorphus CBS 117.55]